METLELVLSCLMMAFFLISLILNILGIHLLTRVCRLGCSKYLLINLSISEIYVSIGTIFYTILYLSNVSSKILKITTKVLWTSYICWLFAMFLIVIDRFFGGVFPLKHRIVVTKKRMLRVIASVWLIAFSFGIAPFFDERLITFNVTYFFIALDVLYILLCIITYGSILVKISLRKSLGQHRDSSRDSNSSSRESHILKRNKRFFRTVGVIILTFVLFVLVPDLIFFTFFSGQVHFPAVLNMCFGFGMMLDPVVYILFQPDTRRLFKQKFCRQRREDLPQQNSSVRSSVL